MAVPGARVVQVVVVAVRRDSRAKDNRAARCQVGRREGRPGFLVDEMGVTIARKMVDGRWYGRCVRIDHVDMAATKEGIPFIMASSPESDDEETFEMMCH